MKKQRILFFISFKIMDGYSTEHFSDNGSQGGFSLVVNENQTAENLPSIFSKSMENRKIVF